MNKRAQELIRLLDLAPHPEGGYFKEVYRSEMKVASPVPNEIRSAMTDIYFLLTAGQFSLFHKVRHDEIWNFYEGDPLELMEIKAGTLDVDKIVLGQSDTRPNFKYCVKGGNWQAAYSTGDYSLVGCTVAPGFDFADFELLKDNADMSESVVTKYQDLSRFI